MKRRWFGVFLALFSSIASLLYINPAFAYSECHWVDSQTILCDGTAKFVLQNGKYMLENSILSSISNISADHKTGTLTEVSSTTSTANTSNINLGNPENATASPGSNNTPASISCSWIDKNDITCGTSKYVSTNGTTFILDASNQIGSISADKASATKTETRTNPTNVINTPVVLTDTANATKDAAGAAATPPPNCDDGPGFTWVVCGIIKMFVGENGIVNQIRDSFIVPFLKMEPMSRKDATGNDTAIYKVWSSFRNVATVFFVLVFILIIIGTAIGFDNYTIKRVLPHLVAGFILVPFSWYICAIVIDIGNVLGQGMTAMINPLIALDPTKVIDLTSDWTAVFKLGGAAVGTAVALTGAIATFGFGAVMSLVIAFVGVFLTLIMRQILIMLFIALSPFALLAWVLPNTEKWFRTWWQNFFKLVMMYPIIMLLFEAGRLFAVVASTVQMDAALKTIIEIIALTLPLFLVPFAFKFAGSGLAMANNAVGKFTGAADRQFGKDSQMARNAAANREIKNMERGKALGNAASDASGLKKAALAMGSRAAYRRAGHALPMRKSGRGMFSNPAGLLENEKAYSAAKAAMGILDANDKNRKEGVPGESDAERTQAEMLSAQQKKLQDRGMRLGMVQAASQLTQAGMAEANKNLVNGTMGQSRNDMLRKLGKAEGDAKAAVSAENPSAHALLENAAHHAEVSMREQGKNVTDENESETLLDEIAAETHNAANPGHRITPAQARERRIQNISNAAGIAASNKVLEKEMNVMSANIKSKELTEAEMRRSGVNKVQALKNRINTAMYTGVNRNVRAGIAAEGQEQTWAELDKARGGAPSTDQLLAASRLNSRDAISKELAASDSPLYGQKPNGTDRVSNQQLIDNSREELRESFDNREAQISAGADVFQKDVKEMMASNPGMSLAGARAAVHSARSRASFTATSDTRGRQVQKELSAKASVARDINNQIKGEAKLVRTATPGISKGDAQIIAAENLRGRQFEAVAAKAGQEASFAREEEIKDAFGAKAGIEGKMEEEIDNVLIEQVQTEARQAGAELPPEIARQRAQAIRPAQYQAAQAKAQSNLLGSVGQAAQIASKERYVTRASQAQGAPVAHDAFIRQSTIEAAGNAAAAEAVQLGLSLEDTKQHIENKRTQAAAAIDAGTISRAEQEQAAIVATSVAAKDKAIRDAGSVDAQVAAVNRAVSDPSPEKLDPEQQLEVETETATAGLAARRGQDEALWVQTRPGANLNRSFATAKTAQQSVIEEKILDERVQQAKKEYIEITRVDKKTGKALYDPTDPETDLTKKRTLKEKVTIESANLSDFALEEMASDITESLANGRTDRAIALANRLGTVAKGRGVLRDIQKNLFGKNEFEAANPETFDGKGKIIWDKMVATVPFAAAPDLHAPYIAIFKGKKPSDFAAMDWRTQKEYLDYVDSKETRAEHPKWHKQAASAIAQAVTNKNTSEKLEDEQYNVMAERMFMADTSGKLIDSDSLTPFGRQVYQSNPEAVKIIWKRYHDNNS